MNNIMTEGIYACPHCLGRLSDDGSRLRCDACGKMYGSAGAIRSFASTDSEFFWGVPLKYFGELKKESSSVGWKDAMHAFMDKMSLRDGKIAYQRTFGARRAVINILIPFKRGMRVLDVGGGLGTISLTLAGIGAHVAVADKALHNLRYVSDVAQNMKVSQNINFVHISNDTPHLPFAAGSFDAVLLNGVLEWVSTGKPGVPTTNQINFLKETARVLKPEGQVYIGIENRISYKYFFGVPEGHIAMRFGALLPRNITRLYLKMARNQEFKEYTYSIFGYERMLEKASFRSKKFFITYPQYASASYVLPVQRRDYAGGIEVETPHWSGTKIGQYFSPCYSMVASKGALQHTLIERILDEVRSNLGPERKLYFKDFFFRVTSGGKACLNVCEDGAIRWYLQIGLTSLATAFIDTNKKALSYLSERLKGDATLENFSKSVCGGKIEGISYNLELFWSGKNLLQHTEESMDRGQTEENCAKALKVLVSLHIKAGKRVKLDEALFESLFAGSIRDMRSWFKDTEWTEHSSWLERITAWMKDLLLGGDFAVVPYHGDFVPNNCIIDEKGGIKVLDWDLFRPEGLPLIDWVTFVMNIYRPFLKSDMIKNGKDPESIKFHGYPESFAGPEHEGRIMEYLSAMGLGEELFLPIMFMWWVMQLEDWRSVHLFNPEWRRLRVFPIIDRWKALFKERGIDI